jgi:hypothetical protein
VSRLVFCRHALKSARTGSCFTFTVVWRSASARRRIVKFAPAQFMRPEFHTLNGELGRLLAGCCTPDALRQDSGRILKGLYRLIAWAERTFLLTNENLSCHDRAVVCISRGMPDVEGEHVEADRDKRAWAVGSGCGIAGTAS